MLYKLIPSFFLVILLSSSAFAQGFLKTEGKRIVNEKGENVLLRGMGLGGWMLQEGYMLRVNGEGMQHKIRSRIEELVGAEKTQEFYDLWLANHTRKIDIDSMKRWGFNSVRLPMHYNLYTLPVEQEPVRGQQTWLTKGFEMTDALLSWCKANNMYLILDLHAAPGGQGNDFNISDRDPSKPSLWDSEENKQKMIALWRKLAERYANEPWIGAYDIINEPNWGFTDPVNDKNGLKEENNAALRKLMQDVTAAIREVDKNHIVIIEGNGWGNNYKGVFPPWDDNMVVSFHKYWNYNDKNSIQHMLDTREQFNIPVWVGETGENTNVWFNQAIRLLEQENIGWAWWPLKKLGINNPLEIKSNPNYDKILEYWSGKGPKPDAANAYNGLMELGNALKLENNVVHRDVIDAMFRQVSTQATKPFKSVAVSDKTNLDLVDYDLGRNGIAYFDTDTANYRVSNGPRGGNRGRNYRNDGVDIYLDSATMTGYYLGSIETGEWLQYTVNVTKAGKYNLKLMVSSDNDKGKLSIAVDNTPSKKAIGVPKTGGAKQWQTIDVNDVTLKKGQTVIKIAAEEGGFNMKSVQFVQAK